MSSSQQKSQSSETGPEMGKMMKLTDQDIRFHTISVLCIFNSREKSEHDEERNRRYKNSGTSRYEKYDIKK